MKSLFSARMENQKLEHYSQLCDRYKTQIDLWKAGLDKSDPRHAYYDDQIVEYNKAHYGYTQRIKNNNRSIVFQSSMAVFICLLFVVSFIFEPTITGNVVFSDVSAFREQFNLDFSKNQTIELELTKPITTFALSGYYEGEGYATVYLEFANESKLVYSTQTSAEFESVCGTACYLDSYRGDYTIRIIVADGMLHLGHIEYLEADISEFSLSPQEVVVNLNDTRFIKNSFDIYRGFENNVTLAIYTEGELSLYTTLYDSLVELSGNNIAHNVRYDIDLPYDLESGTYTQKIVVRYLPAGPFLGAAPTEEHLVTVTVGSERASPGGFPTVLVLVILILVLVANIFYFLLRSWNRRD